MELNQEYDFAIIGEHPAGLWAAHHLIGLGKKVIVLPLGTENSMNVLPRKVAEVFQIPESEWVNRELNPIQVITGGRRVRVMPTLAQFQDELHFNYAHPLRSGETPVPELLRGLNYLTRGSETAPTWPDDWSFISSKLFDTIYFEKETGWIARFMMESLKRLGATIAPQKSLKQIFIDRKNFVGVQLSGTSKMIPVKSAFINTQFDFVNQLLNFPLAPKSIPIAWKFEVRFECGVEFLPVGLTNRLIYVERDAPILDITRENLGSFSLKTILPLNDTFLDRGEQQRLAARMLKVAQRLLPDLEYNLKKVSPDIRDPERAMTIELPALYPFQDLKRIPTELLNYGSGSGLGFQTTIQDLYITGPESNPRDGIWGAYQAVTQALEHLGKREQNPVISQAFYQ